MSTSNSLPVLRFRYFDSRPPLPRDDASSPAHRVASDDAKRHVTPRRRRNLALLFHSLAQPPTATAGVRLPFADASARADEEPVESWDTEIRGNRAVAVDRRRFGRQDCVLRRPRESFAYIFMFA